MRLWVPLVCLAVLVSGCGDQGEAGGDGLDTEVCDRLTLEDSSRVAGVEYTVNGQANDICFYQRPGTDQAFGLRVIAYSDDFDKVVADSEELGYTAIPVEIPGADRAVALRGRNRSVVAEQDGKAFEVSFNGDVATAERLMAVFLGGAAVGAGPRPVQDPCASVSDADVRRLLGVPAPARTGTDEVALKSCVWRAGKRELVVAAGRGRGPVEEFWDENFFVAEDVEPEELRVAGAEGALLVTAQGGDDTVGVAVSRGDLSHVVTVSGAPDSRAAAIEVARKVVSRS